MSSSEFPTPNTGGQLGAVTAQIEAHRAKPMVWHNNRFFIACSLTGSAICLFFAGCMVLLAISMLIPLSAIGFMRVLGAAQWGLGGLCMGLMCPWLWKRGMQMAQHRVTLDARGVDFKMGTKKKPIGVFLPWEQVSAIKHERVGNAQQYTVEGSDGSYARFTSYTFFRPKKVARLIAERTGLAIQEG